jgi:hypothetical protein
MDAACDEKFNRKPNTWENGADLEHFQHSEGLDHLHLEFEILQEYQLIQIPNTVDLGP